MRAGDIIREIFYPTFVAGIIGTVWFLGHNRWMSGDAPPQWWPAADPALSQRVLEDNEPKQPQSISNSPATTRPIAVTALDRD
jgi:hypothetical protein